MRADLIDRCAAFGWTLRPDGGGWELLGNGAPASFRSTESLIDWLDHQEPPRTMAPAAVVVAQPTYAQSMMELI
jgi:hypothetical protein